MITYAERESKIVVLRPGDKGFEIHDGFMYAQRAGFDISWKCPEHIGRVILDAIQRGWLQPIASVKRSEYIFDILERK